MKNIKTNYVILVALIILTVFLTLILSNLYLSKNKTVSILFNYSNKITSKEFDAYMLENSDSIIYISDKYDTTKNKFENKFQKKINSLNLKSKLVFIEKNDINDKFVSMLKNDYSINIELENTPIIITVVDKKISKVIYITELTNVDTFIEYRDFE